MLELPPSGMRIEVKRALAVLALVVGFAGGFWLATGSDEATSLGRPQKGVAVVGGRGVDAAPAKRRGAGEEREVASQLGEPSQAGDGVGVEPPPTVEVMVDDSPEPATEITAAHAARQVRRQEARETRENSRRDFLSDLNLDLLTAEQRKVHALYVEANETRSALLKEIAALRKEGGEVPAEMQSRLADAESVLRADREREQDALREAAARAAGLDESAVRQLMKDLAAIEKAFAP